MNDSVSTNDSFYVLTWLLSVAMSPFYACFIAVEGISGMTNQTYPN